ncbi:DUF1796 family putative cysteine peptidase [Paenibacillus sp.]|uniref:DUF1796 family putative cysteine peptidase n=1 Tax=Paenibacillus sp. TaxID=58172 RepID=UPI00282D3089|nr:DUF1796 family putative cysteine peptidase [Paenibacillus sp.]MDR0268063.1 papain-like cysteine peptidase [Paenibacillus sp.]
MDWNQNRGTYHAFISLGEMCQTAHQLRRLGLRRFSGPLDWFTSSSTPKLTHLLKTRFNGFMELNHLHLINMVDRHYVLRDLVYQVDSYHDFPVPYHINQLYPQFKEQVDRRISRFLKTIKTGPVCFVRTHTSSSEARLLEQVLSDISHRDFRMLIVNLHNQPGKGIIYEDWGLQRVSSVTIPSGRDWRGSDYHWNLIMQGFNLNS